MKNYSECVLNERFQTVDRQQVTALSKGQFADDGNDLRRMFQLIKDLSLEFLQFVDRDGIVS
jgi:hypothetical protein